MKNVAMAWPGRDRGLRIEAASRRGLLRNMVNAKRRPVCGTAAAGFSPQDNEGV
jgi:hypothetical protein